MAEEILASLDDINTWLPDDKAKMEDSEDDLLQIDIARYVRSLLSGYFSPATLSSWDSPVDTPEQIRGIAGRLIASKYYAKLYSEDIPEGSVYAQGLYDEANMIIDGIRNGTIVVLDANDTPVALTTEVSLTSGDFLPNDSTTGPYFTMEQVFS